MIHATDSVVGWLALAVCVVLGVRLWWRLEHVAVSLRMIGTALHRLAQIRVMNTVEEYEYEEERQC